MTSTIPANAKKPSDRQAKKNEAKPEEAQDIVFEFDGHEYTVASDAFDDIEIVEALEDERHITVMRLLLGKAQWTAWKERNKNDDGRVKMTAAQPFVKALFDAAGQGN